MIRFAESLGGVETLVTYPTTQTHADVPKEIRERNGITESTLRFSVGIEKYRGPDRRAYEGLCRNRGREKWRKEILILTESSIGEIRTV